MPWKGEATDFQRAVENLVLHNVYWKVEKLKKGILQWSSWIRIQSRKMWETKSNFSSLSNLILYLGYDKLPA